MKTGGHPSKHPLAVGPLRFGIDIDGTISQAPRHFKNLIQALLSRGDEVYIITGRYEDMRQETEELLAQFGIQYNELILRPLDWDRTIPDFKVKMVLEKHIHLMLDDDEANCWAIEQQTPTLAAHVLPIPEMPEAHQVKSQIRKEKAEGKRE